MTASLRCNSSPEEFTNRHVCAKIASLNLASWVSLTLPFSTANISVFFILFFVVIFQRVNHRYPERSFAIIWLQREMEVIKGPKMSQKILQQELARMGF